MTGVSEARHAHAAHDDRPPSRFWRLLPGLTLAAVVTVTSTSEWTLARTVLGLDPAVAWAVPVAIDSYVVAALRTGRDVPAAVTVMAGALAASMGAHLAADALPAGQPLPAIVTAPAATAIMTVLVVVAWRVHVLIDHLDRIQRRWTDDTPAAPGDAVTADPAAPSKPGAPPPTAQVDPGVTGVPARLPRSQPSGTLTDGEILAAIDDQVPTVRSLMRTYSIGQARATRIRKAAHQNATAHQHQHIEQPDEGSQEPSLRIKDSISSRTFPETIPDENHKPEEQTHIGITDRVGQSRSVPGAPEGDAGHSPRAGGES